MLLSFFLSLLFFLHRFFFLELLVVFLFFWGTNRWYTITLAILECMTFDSLIFFSNLHFFVCLCVFFDRFSIDRCVFVCQFSSYFPLFLLLLFFFICKIIVFVCVCSEVVVVTHTHAHTDYTWKCNCSILSCPYKKMIIPVSKLKIIKSGQQQQQQHCRL